MSILMDELGGEDVSLSGNELVGAEPAPLRRSLPATIAEPLARFVSPLTPVDALRNLVYVSAAGADGERLCRVDAVLDIRGVWVAHRGIPAPLASVQGLEEHLAPAWEYALEAAREAQYPAVTGVEFQLDRTGEALARIFASAARPPADSGADFHVWHLAPELDELWERVKPESWWERRLEDLQTLLGRVRTRGQGGL